MVWVLGWDIGGANTKAAYISAHQGKAETVKVAVEYFPVWKEPENLADVLLTLKNRLDVKRLDVLGVTMTAELSDAFQTKREGVHHILGCIKIAFPNMPIYVLTADAQMESKDFAKREPFKVASANWAATGWLVSQKIKDCVVVDIGSTSTSIIPIIDGKVSARGKTDLEKLMCGELVYTGSLRTNVAAIVDSVPLRGDVAGVSSELFTQAGDVHLLLGNIKEEDYTNETADGRGKTKHQALARLARLVCADTEMLTEQEIFEIAKYVYDKQLSQVSDGLTKVYSNVKSAVSTKVPVVITGLGKDFLARKAAEKVGVDEIVDLGALFEGDVDLATPAFGVALMAARKFEGETV